MTWRRRLLQHRNCRRAMLRDVEREMKTFGGLEEVEVFAG